ncbi:unnamed protein product, partial [Prorocentrum cordatum]
MARGSLAADSAAVYKNVGQFKAALDKFAFVNRAQFLRVVKDGAIEGTSPCPNIPSTRALPFAQHFGLVENECECSRCGADSSLCLQNNRGVPGWRWRGPRYDDACECCRGREKRVGVGGFFDGVDGSNWLSKLDAMMMWVLGYDRGTIVEGERESERTSHRTVERWTDEFQRAACKRVDEPAAFETKRRGQASKKRELPMKGPMKKPTRGRIKKPPMKPKFAKQADGERGARCAGGSNSFVFRVLGHPAGALGGRPRGAKEMVANLRLIGLRKDDVFASDRLRAENGWPRTRPPHEIVNHPEGEVAGASGYSANAIEAKRGVVKREKLDWDSIEMEFVPSGRCALCASLKYKTQYGFGQWPRRSRGAAACCGSRSARDPPEVGWPGQLERRMSLSTSFGVLCQVDCAAGPGSAGRGCGGELDEDGDLDEPLEEPWTPQRSRSGLVSYSADSHAPLLEPPVRSGQVWHLRNGGRDIAQTTLTLHPNGFCVSDEPAGPEADATSQSTPPTAMKVA